MIDCELEAEHDLVVSCRCKEGPFTFTIDDIIINIVSNLGPDVTDFFQREGLKLEKLLFTMTVMY